MNQKLFVKFPVTHCYIAGIYESFTLVSLSSCVLFLFFFLFLLFYNTNAQAFHSG